MDAEPLSTDETAEVIAILRNQDAILGAPLVERLAATLAEWEQSFDLYDAAMRRGTKMWQDATGDRHTFPDTAKLVAWLLAQLADAKDLIDRAEGLVVDYLLDGEPDKQLIPFSPWMERLAAWRKAAGGT